MARELLDTALIQRNVISISGGSKTVNYSLGASTLDQDGIIGKDKSNFNRKTFRSNVGFDLSDKIKLNTSLIYSNIGRTSVNDFGLGSVLFNAINMPATLPAYDENNNFTLAPSNLGIEIINPLAQVHNTYNSYSLNSLNGSIGIEVQPFEGFTFTSRIGFNSAYSKGKNFSPIVDYGGKVFDVTRSTVAQNRINDNDYTFDTFINYAKGFGDHQLEVTLGTTIYSTWGTACLLPVLTFPTMRGPMQTSVWPMAYRKKSNPFIHLRTKTLVLLWASAIRLQRQGFCFGLAPQRCLHQIWPLNRWESSHQYRCGYILSEEAFLADNEWIDFLKFRVSYGFLGSDKIGDYLYLSQLSGEGVYVFDNQLTFGRAVGIVPNSAIKWEASEQFDVGLDLTFLKSKLNLTADYFSKTTNDLLIQYIPVSGILGTSAPGSGSPTVNAGEVVNKGFEFALSYRDQWFKDFNFSSSFNFTTLQNEVTQVNN